MDVDAKILQIIPASGWGAIYTGENGSPMDPIVCFALVEQDVDGELDRIVRPMVVDGRRLMFADDAKNFECVAYNPQNIEIT